MVYRMSRMSFWFESYHCSFNTKIGVFLDLQHRNLPGTVPVNYYVSSKATFYKKKLSVVFENVLIVRVKLRVVFRLDRW